jgi:hypothetical protein
MLAAGCTTQRAPGPPVDLPPDIALTGVTVRQYRGSSLRLIATTPSLGFHREGRLAGQLRAETLVVDSLIDGLHVETDRVTGDALGGALTGTNVRARTTGGTLVTSPVATFHQHEGESGTASTDAGVKVVAQAFTLQAETGTVDLATERAELDAVTTRTTP